MIFKSEKIDVKLNRFLWKIPSTYLGSCFLKWYSLLNVANCLTQQKQKKKKKICIYIISLPRNEELHGIRSYQKKGTWQWLCRKVLENTDIGIKRNEVLCDYSLSISITVVSSRCKSSLLLALKKFLMSFYKCLL